MEVEELIAGFNFSMLKGKVDSRILDALTVMGLEKPTRIQAETLPHLLQGNDIIGTAKTGSGKTLAFLIPVVDNLIKIEFSKKHGTGCIILSPTRELALQTCDVLNKLLVGTGLTHGLIVGGGKKSKDTSIIKNGISIVVSTPGRLLDHLKNTKEFNCKNLKCLVVDEADKLLDAGFEKELNGIIKLLPKTRQTVLFSATINEKVQNLARLALRSNPELISIKNDDKSTVSGLKQGYFLCPMDKRIPWLFKMLKKSKKKKVMVFFSSCKSVLFHYEFFRNYCEASVMQLHGQLTQPKRREAFQKFLDAKNGTLFCTDIAARGLDFPSVDWIVQYDPPIDPREYIHRVGRTARGLNTKGNAVLVLRPEEEEFLTYLRQENITLDRYTFEEPSEKILRLLEDLVKNNGVLKLLARRAYLGYLRNYRLHPMKHIFSLDTLDLATACKAFGFTSPPHSDIRPLQSNSTYTLDKITMSGNNSGNSREAARRDAEERCRKEQERAEEEKRRQDLEREEIMRQKEKQRRLDEHLMQYAATLRQQAPWVEHLTGQSDAS